MLLGKIDEARVCCFVECSGASSSPQFYLTSIQTCWVRSSVGMGWDIISCSFMPWTDKVIWLKFLVTVCRVYELRWEKTGFGSTLARPSIYGFEHTHTHNPEFFHLWIRLNTPTQSWCVTWLLDSWPLLKEEVVAIARRHRFNWCNNDSFWGGRLIHCDSHVSYLLFGLYNALYIGLPLTQLEAATSSECSAADSFQHSI